MEFGIFNSVCVLPRYVERYAGTGADQLSFGMLSTSISLENCQEAVETFGKHVLPQFDKDAVHSTTKQRLAATTASA